MKKLTVKDFNEFGELKVRIIKKKQEQIKKQNYGQQKTGGK